MKDLFGYDLQVNDYFLYSNASEKMTFSICKVLEVYAHQIKAKTLIPTRQKNYYLSQRINTYGQSDRMIKYPESMIPKDILELFNK